MGSRIKKTVWFLLFSVFLLVMSFSALAAEVSRVPGKEIVE